ncbi:homeobox protein H2.0 [Drosophila suzukii]|uniref:Homeobox protein H2.0 n=1 Tax=Drosophila suzukii TaxID=28584 RepID=A0AB40DMQ3_DROSZ
MLFHESAASMEQRMPENLARMKGPDPMESDPTTKESCAPTTVVISTPSTTTSTTKLKLSFSVDRLLASEPGKYHRKNSSSPLTRSCCDRGIFCSCLFPHCYSEANIESRTTKHTPVPASTIPATTHTSPYVKLNQLYPTLYIDYKSVMKPTPIRVARHGQYICKCF